MQTGLRLAAMEDHARVVEMFKAAIQTMNRQGILQWDEIYPAAEDLAADIRAGQMYLLEEAGQLCAAIVLNSTPQASCAEQYAQGAWQGKEQDPTAVVHRVCVSPACQQKGYGRQTMLLAEEQLRAAGTVFVRLDAFCENPYSVRLYEKLGYRQVGRVRFRKGDFYLYEKRL